MTTREDLLADAAREELLWLWSDFMEAVRDARVVLNPLNERTGWSGTMLNLADRIGVLARLVGPTRWEEVQVELLLDGWWRVIHERVGLEPGPFDEDEVRGFLEQRT